MTSRSDVIIGSDWLILILIIKFVQCGFAWLSTEPLVTTVEGGGRGGGGAHSLY
jgi:hypothetical protein